MNFVYLEFNCSIIRELSLATGSIYVFPNEKSKKQAIRHFQQRWQGEELATITMEELLSSLVLPELPVIGREAGKIAFYEVLTPADKDYFKIGNFFDSLAVSSGFFDFWQELAEEQITVESVENTILETESFGESGSWKLEIFQRFCALREKYRQLLKAQGLTDSIFVSGNVVNLSFLAGFNKINIINQFYYTKQEISLIKELDNNYEVTLYHQLPEELFKKTRFNIDAFSLKDLDKNKINTKKVNIIKTGDSYAQLVALIKTLAEAKKIEAIVDNEFFSSNYSALLSRQEFGFSQTAPFNRTKIFIFLSLWLEILEGISDNRIKAKTLSGVLLNQVFTAYYALDDTYIGVLEKHIRDGQYYVKIDFIKEQSFGSHLEGLRQMKDCEQFACWLKALNLEYFKEEIYDKVFYNLFNNLSRMQSNLKLKASSPLEALFCLRYFLYLLGSESNKYAGGEAREPGEKVVEITNLADTRNLDYQNIVFLNASEGSLPSTRRNQFLLSEKERKSLGLKTYEDIILREKYYFMRLILSCEEVTIIGIESESKNMALSSFVEEIKLYLSPNIIVAETPLTACSFGNFLKELYPAETASIFLQKEEKGVLKGAKDILPYAKAETLNKALSYSSFSRLDKCAYRFFLEDVAKLKRMKEATEFLASNVLGEIVHEIFSVLGKHIKANLSKEFTSFYKAITTPSQLVKQTIMLAFDKRILFVPEKYRHGFLEEIIFPALAESVSYFFKALDKLIPISEVVKYSTEESLEESPSNKENIKLVSRADLIIETKAGEAYIFDFKTGKDKDDWQLDFYELYYFTLQNKEGKPWVKGKYFYSVFEETMRPRGNSEPLTLAVISESLEALTTAGHYPRAKVKTICVYCDYKELCRLHE